MGDVLTAAEREYIEVAHRYADAGEEMPPDETDALLAIIDRIAAQLDLVTAERDAAQYNYRFMVEHAADEKLDGYRELGARAAAAEQERDIARGKFDRLKGWREMVEPELERLRAIDRAVEAGELRWTEAGIAAIKNEAREFDALFAEGKDD